MRQFLALLRIRALHPFDRHSYNLTWNSLHPTVWLGETVGDPAVFAGSNGASFLVRHGWKKFRATEQKFPEVHSEKRKRARILDDAL